MRKALGALAIACSIALLTQPRPAAAAGPSAQLQLLADGINAYRAANGLPSVAVSATLAASAQWMATSMAANNYFSHTSTDGRTPQQRMAGAGYPAYLTWTGENIAAGFAAPAATLVAWQNSPEHNAILLSASYHAVGLGYAYNASSVYGTYWVADFGGVVDGVLAGDTGYHARWEAQSAYAMLAPGETAQLYVIFRNIGSRPWLRGVSGAEARLGTNEPTDRAYPELAWNWFYYNRPAAQSVDAVAPGSLATFAFAVRAPPAPGDYRLALRPVVDGTTWLEDFGVFLLISVR